MVPRNSVGLSAASAICSTTATLALDHRKQHKGVWVGSQSEKAGVIASGGPGINLPLPMGKNFDGSDFTIPPMQEGEDLYVGKPGDTRSATALIKSISKQLAQMTSVAGSRDVSAVEFWHSTCRAPFEPHSPLFKSRIFTDNITVWAPDAQSVRNLLDTVDLSSHCQEGREKYHLLRCSEKLKVDPVPLCKYKISLCDVKRETVNVIHKLLDFDRMLSIQTLLASGAGRDVRGLRQAMIKEFRDTYWVDLHGKRLEEAVTEAGKIRWIDTDLAIDKSGTLHCRNYEVALMKAKIECKAHSCGANMVKTVQLSSRLGNGKKLPVQFKAYNKIAETMQQGNARDKEIMCKLRYLLNPSTKGLKDAVRTTSVHENGLTRYECTFSRPDSDEIPDLRDMEEVLESLDYLNGTTLVKSSIENHLEMLGSVVSSSVGILFPTMMEWKRLQLVRSRAGQKKQGRGRTKKELSKIPEGYLIRWYNKDTGKFNGFALKSSFVRYADVQKPCSTSALEALAWGSTCKNDPCIFVCVAGPVGAGACSNLELRNCYFRLLQVKRGGNQAQLLTYLPDRYGDFSKARDLSTDWGHAGVDVSKQANIRPAIVSMSTIPSPSTMNPSVTRLQLLPFKDHDALAAAATIGPLMEQNITRSEERRRRVANTGPVCESVQSLTTIERLVTQYQDRGIAGRRGPAGVPRIELQLNAGGDWFKVPVHASEGLFQKLKECEKAGIVISLWIWKDNEHRFRWRSAPYCETAAHPSQAVSTATAEPTPLLRTLPPDNSRALAAKMIPVCSEWLVIIHATLQPHSSGKGLPMVVVRFEGVPNEAFYLPKTAATFLTAECHGFEGFKFIGWGLRHLGGEPVRTVQKASSPEQRIILCDSTGRECFRNFHKDDHDASIVTPSKRPALNDEGLPAAKRHRPS